MTKPTRKQEEEFIRESNAIEREYDEESFVDAMEAWDFIKGKEVLTIPEILETHRLLMRNRPIPLHSLGNWRSCELRVGPNPIGTTWRAVPEAIDEWVGVMNEIVPKDFGGLESWSQELHVRYEKIHPFIDGNGRTGRMFMNWWRLRNGLPLLTIHEGEEQMDYYQWFK